MFVILLLLTANIGLWSLVLRMHAWSLQMGVDDFFYYSVTSFFCAIFSLGSLVAIVSIILE